MAIIIRTQIQMDSANRGLKKILDASAKAKKNIDDLNDSLKTTVTLITEIADKFNAIRGGKISVPRSGAGSGGNSGSRPGTRPPIVDPYQNYAFRRNQNAAFRARYNQQQGIGNPSSNPVMNMLMRSRIDSTGNLMPLMMDLAKIMGPEVTAVAAVTLTAVRAGMKVISDADALLGSYRNALVMGGGTTGDARTATRIQSAIGVDVSGVGRNLMSGYGPVAAAGAGVNPLGGPFGDMNYTEKGLKILDYIRRATNFNEARRRAELSGSPEAAGVNLLTPTTYNRLRSTQAGEASEGNIRNQAEFQANVAILKDSFGQLESALSSPVVKELAGAAAGLSDLFETLNKLPNVTGIQLKLAGFINSIGPLGTIMHLLQMIGVVGGSNEHTDATQDNTKAIQNLTRSINQGVYGGGSRAQLPSAQRQSGYYGANPTSPYGVL